MFKVFNALSLRFRIVAITVLLLITAIAVNYAVFVNGFRESAIHALQVESAIFTAVADEAKNHASLLLKDGVFDQDYLIEDLEAVQEAGRPYTDAKIFNTLPIVVGWTSAMNAAEHEGVDFHLAAFHARNKENEPKSGSFTESLLKELNAQVTSNGDDFIARTDTETNTYHYMRAITLTDDCMTCHGNPGPDNESGRDILGFPMERWAVGDMHGAYHVIMPLSVLDEKVAGFINMGLMWTVPLVAVSIGFLIFFLHHFWIK